MFSRSGRHEEGSIDVLIFTPAPTPVDEEVFLDRVAGLGTQARAPFAEASVAFLNAISTRLMRAPEARHAPQVTVLAYWLRAAALQRLRRQFEETVGAFGVPTPRGIALHLPPANVDTLFVYSWALSVLAGNANVVRMPSEINDVAGLLLRTIAEVALETGETERHLFCSYPQDGGTTARLSAFADLRMIWGGDVKVAQLSTIPVRPDGVSLGFPDRYSFSAIAVAAYLGLDDAARDALAERFYNDVFWFDQMGCGSPRLLYWVGDRIDPAAEQDFFSRLDRVAARRRYTVDTAVALSKFTYANRLAADERVRRVHRYSNNLLVMEADESIDLRGRVHGGGVLAQARIARLEDIAARLGRRDQTLTHFGFDADALRRFAEAARGRGLYRIVPIGEALQFEAIWDGVDLLRHMSRLIVVRGAA